MEMKIEESPLGGVMVVTSEYGLRVHPVLGTTRMHSGMDFQAALGTDVHASVTGDIIRAGWSNSVGNFIVLQDPITKEAVIYCHLNEINIPPYGRFGLYNGVDTGQTIVKRKIKGGENEGSYVAVHSGDIIGKTGDTGNLEHDVFDLSGGFHPEYIHGYEQHLHFEVVPMGTANGIAELPGESTGDIRLGIDSTFPHHNPRLYLEDYISPTINTGTYGLSVEDDKRGNIISGNTRGNTYELKHGGDDTITDPSGDDKYFIYLAEMGHVTITDTDRTGTITIIDENKNSIEITGKADFITDGLGHVPDHETGQQRWSLKGNILERVDSAGVISATGTNLKVLVEGNPYRTITIKNFDFTEGSQTLGISVPMYKEMTVHDIGLYTNYIKTVRLKDRSGMVVLYNGIRVHVDIFDNQGILLHHIWLVHCTLPVCGSGPTPTMVALGNGNVVVSTGGYLQQVFIINTKTGVTSEINVASDFGISIGTGTEMVVTEANSDGYFYIAIALADQGIKRIKYNQSGHKVSGVQFLNVTASMQEEDPTWKFGYGGSAIAPIEGGQGAFVLHYSRENGLPKFTRLVTSSFDLCDADLYATFGADLETSPIRQNCVKTSSGKVLFMARNVGKLYVINPDGSCDKVVQLSSIAVNSVIRKSHTLGRYYITYQLPSGYTYGIQEIDGNGNLIGDRIDGPYLESDNFNIVPMEDGSIVFVNGHDTYYKLSRLYPDMEFGPAIKQTICEVEEVPSEILVASYNPATPYEPIVLSSASQSSILDGGDALVVEMYPGYGDTIMVSSSAIGSRTVMYGGSGSNVYTIESTVPSLDLTRPASELPTTVEIYGADISGKDKVNITSICLQTPDSFSPLVSDIMASVKPYNGTSIDGTPIVNGSCLTFGIDGKPANASVDTASLVNATTIIFPDITPEQLRTESVISSLFLPVNHAPVIEEGKEVLERKTTKDTPTEIVDLCEGVIDPDGDEIKVSAIEEIPLGECSECLPPNGTLETKEGGLFQPLPFKRGFFYAPAPGFIGLDPFNVTCSDGQGGWVTRPVDMDVLPGPQQQPDDRSPFPIAGIVAPAIVATTALIVGGVAFFKWVCKRNEKYRKQRVASQDQGRHVSEGGGEKETKEERKSTIVTAKASFGSTVELVVEPTFEEVQTEQPPVPETEEVPLTQSQVTENFGDTQPIPDPKSGRVERI